MRVVHSSHNLAAFPPGKPRARPRPWSNEEQQSFWNALETYGRDWHKVAASVKTRDIKSVKSHVQKEFAKRAAEGKPLPAKVPPTDTHTLNAHTHSVVCLTFIESGAV